MEEKIGCNEDFVRFFKEIHLLVDIPKSALNTFGHGQMGLLMCVAENKEVNPTNLAKELEVGSARIGNALKDLEKKGLIKRKRDEKDLRKTVVVLTSEGEKAVKNIEKYISECGNYLIDSFGKERFDHFLQELIALNECIQKIKKEECKHV